MENSWIGIEEVAAILGMHKRNAWNLIKRDGFPYKRWNGHKNLWARAEVEAFSLAYSADKKTGVTTECAAKSSQYITMRQLCKEFICTPDMVPLLRNYAADWPRKKQLNGEEVFDVRGVELVLKRREDARLEKKAYEEKRRTWKINTNYTLAIA